MSARIGLRRRTFLQMADAVWRDASPKPPLPKRLRGIGRYLVERYESKERAA